MESINDVFSELDSRIDGLKNLPKILSALNLISDDYNISRIERNLYRFPSDAEARINIALKELQELKSLGVNLINKKQHSDDFETIEGKDDTIYVPKVVELDKKTRETYYKTALNEINFYIKELNRLKSNLNSSAVESKNSPVTLTINPDFSFTELRVEYPESNPILNKAQLVLLFHYLKNERLILPYENSSLSILVKHLTGYSENTIRKDLTYIEDLKKASSRQNNLSIIKDALQNVIKAIEIDLKSSKKL